MIADSDQRLQPRDDNRVQTVGDQREQRLLGLMQRRTRNIAHTLRGWRLDQLPPTAQDQLVSHALRAALTRGDMLSQPPGQRLGIRDAALPLQLVADQREWSTIT
jgi:hypothetical protein